MVSNHHLLKSHLETFDTSHILVLQIGHVVKWNSCVVYLTFSTQLDFFLIPFPRVYYVTVSRVDVKAPSWTKCILRTKFAKSCKNTVQERLFGDVDRNHCFRRNFRKFPAEFIWWNSLLTSCPSLKANPTTKHINLYTYKKYWLWKWSVIKNCYINSSNLILT